MPEKMRTRPTNVVVRRRPRGARVRRSGDPRRVGGSSTPRAPERRPANPALGGKGRSRAEARLPLDAQYHAIYARVVVSGDERSFAGVAVRVASPEWFAPTHPSTARPRVRATTRRS